MYTYYTDGLGITLQYVQMQYRNMEILKRTMKSEYCECEDVEQR